MIKINSIKLYYSSLIFCNLSLILESVYLSVASLFFKVCSLVVMMAQACLTQISLQETAYYHCISRCVRLFYVAKMLIRVTALSIAEYGLLKGCGFCTPLDFKIGSFSSWCYIQSWYRFVVRVGWRQSDQRRPCHQSR